MESVEDILEGREPAVAAKDGVVQRIEPPRHPGQPPFPLPGIYFNMPEEVYHSIHACSASGIKNMSVSSMDYWANSVLNQEREEKPSKDNGDLTPKELGRAYHCYICEGPIAFDERYAVALDKDLCRDNAKAEGVPFCVTIADIRAAIDAEGVKPKGTSKDALIDQLYEVRADAVVWERMQAEYVASHAGKTMVSPKLFRRIAIAKAMIDNDPQLKDAFKDGHAEVSIFWYDEETGVPMKARLDYIKLLHLIDLKSFANKQGKPVQRAIDMAISNEKYFIPVVVYLEAVDAAKKMIRRDKQHCIHRYQSSVFVDEEGKSHTIYADHVATKDQVDWCWKWAHQPEPEVMFIFQQTGIAPVTRGRVMPTGTTYAITQRVVQALKRKWALCATTYGVDPWVDFERVVPTEDEAMTWAATDFGEVE